ncbi:MAG: 2'-5' RNA ligase family protein, partial [Candidatus Liptonbacteria bacterium]|nr:2'-5' RNA ligase family protein [Candidatus Liptonbacteria bacterium]
MVDMKRRIFVAIVLSGDLQNDILRHEEKWQRLPVRWLDGKNLHITLVPPWYGENIDKVIAQLKTVGQFGKAINIEFQRVCYGPSRAIVPNVIWAEGKESEELLGLKRKIESV